MEKISDANTLFTLDLFKNFNETNPTGNIFFSPFSISSALAMVYLGAKGSTADQMEKVLHFDKAGEIHPSIQSLNTEINKPGECLLKLANRVYTEKTYNFLPEFLNSAAKFYKADLPAVDFQNAADEARKQINQWVEAQTEGKIQNLLTEGTVTSLTRMVLVNAIYFKGSWAHKFNDRATKEMPFRLNKSESNSVQMMYQEKKLNFNYVDEMKLKVLELPYVGKELSMIILLPDDINDDSTGLQQLEKNITFESIQKWTLPGRMRNVKVQVHLPKFKLEDMYDLKSSLTRLGMLDVFNGDRADLSGMTEKPELHLSKVIHKSFVEVNEEGTEAAAATGAIMMLRCSRMPDDIVYFTADHPFLFFIRHNSSNSVLFFGRYCSP
ncbi:leukocyte elastase inhibitor B isoform X2 [Latimeria chalumnae]|uniref:Leukocyte elastase inhibitor n=2 Tax=Latimeria chalumnae TaxID=7897 RepID=H3ARM5_LATCH|nr:PREDICTED: leukocyte elastase inhibitor B-like isoform X2 [Latimeria chalumnae]XP_006007370.1 PREDICTED: leukocyte elastase inhibitor B-like isoform X2 [Latimeria chalumnae]|eukprot:XP_006007369.1 PREDICTED: leukocyte elastase inhibitor B-like isoform X2 [Latimeria chalumnae]